MNKLSSPWEGPFIMMEVADLATYSLQWADSQGISNVWNIEHLRRFYPYKMCIKIEAMNSTLL
jgi:hypothetical protein